MQGQGTLFTECRPLQTTTSRSGYVSHCACGWDSATERTKRYANDVLAYHMNSELTKSLKHARTTADMTV